MCIRDRRSLDFTLTRISDEDLAILASRDGGGDGLMNLHQLYLRSTPVSDDGLAELGKMTSLQTLILDNTKITDDGLVHLKKLSNLYGLALSSTGVTDAGLSQLAGLTRLFDLHVQGTAVTEAGKAHFPDNLNLNLHVYEKPEHAVKFKPSRVIEGWGSVIDPDGDCSISRHADELIISVPGVADYSQSSPKQIGQYVRLELPGDDKILSQLHPREWED